MIIYYTHFYVHTFQQRILRNNESFYGMMNIIYIVIENEKNVTLYLSL